MSVNVRTWWSISPGLVDDISRQYPRLRWPHTVSARALADAIQRTQDCKKTNTHCRRFSNHFICYMPTLSVLPCEQLVSPTFSLVWRRRNQLLAGYVCPIFLPIIERSVWIVLFFYLKRYVRKGIDVKNPVILRFFVTERTHVMQRVRSKSKIANECGYLSRKYAYFLRTTR